jgi:glycosyltransferase involved in cell wall biosynthesis
MAMEVPIVASSLPALRDYLEDGESASLVPPESPEALAEGIVRTLDEPEMARRLARRSREVFESRFTMDQSVAGMVALYRRVANQGGAG